jgi:hypothetical protein
MSQRQVHNIESASPGRAERGVACLLFERGDVEQRTDVRTIVQIDAHAARHPFGGGCEPDVKI